MIGIKGNNLILGLAVSYIIIAIIEIVTPGNLGASVYVTVAFVSLELSALELLKTIIESIEKYLNSRKKLIDGKVIQLQNTIEIIKNYDNLHEKAKECENELEKLKEAVTKNNKYNYIRLFNNIYSVTAVIQSIVCVIQIMITPLKIIPYDALTNNVINICGLVSFAMLFFSCYVTNFASERINLMLLEQETKDRISSYYLNLIEEINHEKDEKYEPTL